MPNVDFTNLDPQVVTLAKAIRTTESNNNYNAVGDNGDSHGAYQFNKGNFAHWASQFGLDPNDFSPVNQDKVAYAKMKTWKDQGYHAGEIAAMWNGAHNENGRPMPNNPHYVEKVQQALQQNQNTPSFNPKPFTNPTPGEPTLPTPPTPKPNDESSVVPDSYSLPSIAGKIGGFAKGLIEPELKAGASAIRAVQATPQIFNEAKQLDFSKPWNAPQTYQGDNPDTTMAKPLLGQKTAVGSSIDENLKTAGNAASQALLLGLGGARPYVPKALKPVQGLLQNLASKSVPIAKKVIAVKGLYDTFKNNPNQGLLEVLFGLMK